MQNWQKFARVMGAMGVALMLAPTTSWAADGVPAAKAASASQPSAGQNASTASKQAAAQTPAQTPAQTSAQTSVKASGSATSQASPPASASPSGRKLALQAPPLDHIMDRQKLRYILMHSTDDGVDPDEGMSVTVSRRATRAPVVVPVGQIYAVPWALMHPTEAWRIFTPIIAP